MSVNKNPYAKFSDDGGYPPSLVRYINTVLDRKDLTAQEMWGEIAYAVWEVYDPKEEGETFEGHPWQLSLETLPREVLLTIICWERKIKGYEQLAKDFGMQTTREEYERGINEYSKKSA